MINGLHSSRIIVMNNDVRLQDQEWGIEHAPNIDLNSAGSINVIKGANALAYGGDALGGVIHYIDEDYAPTHTSEGYFSTRFESNSMGTTNEFGYKINKGKLKFNLFANYINHADFQLPSGRYIQNSRFWGANVKMALGYRKGNYVFNVNLPKKGSYSYLLSYNRMGGVIHRVRGDWEVR